MGNLIARVKKKRIQLVCTSEIEGRYPKSHDMYDKIAEVLDCDVNYLLTEDESFITTCKEEYGLRGEN